MAKKDYSKLNKEELLEVIKNLESKKKYGLVWDEEKVPEKVVVDCQHQLPVLKEVKDKEIITDQNQPTHILIEGDNYHALSVLNYTHKGKIDLIYIDPPYNTGNNDFIYNDRYVEKEDTWRHSKWLSFMSKRLELAKELLTDAGCIFISINDIELAQLKMLCNSIFGEDNFIGNLIWRKKEGGGQTDAYFATEHEYIIGYRKSDNFKWLNKVENFVEKDFNKKDADGNFKLVKLEKWGSGSRKEDRPTMHFPIKNPNGEPYLPIAPDGNLGRWRVGLATMEKLIQNSLIHWELKNSKLIPYEKVYFDNAKEKIKKARSILYDIASTGDGTNELKDIFHQKDTFSNPKPTDLISFIIEHTTNNDSTILDFFAGSGTSCHSILKLNSNILSKRKCILITNNELNGVGKKIIENDPKLNIDEIGICRRVAYPRVKKVINGYQNLKGEEMEGVNNNLRYFKTSFVKNRRNKDQLKIEITKQCTEMLCLKEGIFNLKTTTKDYKIFEQNDRQNNFYMAVFYDFANASLEELKKEMNALKGEKILYCFTLLEKLETINFKGWKDIRLEPIPQKILDIYLEIFKK
jgi:adenine-specific DNA-methyltransferase